MPEKSAELDNGDTILDVWLSNFFQAMETIRDLVEDYNYVSMVSAFFKFLVLTFFLFRIPSFQERFTYRQTRTTSSSTK